MVHAAWSRARRWWETDEEGSGTPDQLAKDVWEIAQQLWEDTSWKRHKYLEFLRLYEGRNLGSLNAVAYQSESGELDLVIPIARSVVEAAQAEIGGQNRPKPEYLTSGADWQTQLKAQLRDRFVLGQLALPQGHYADCWELAQDILLDAEVWGVGALKPYVRGNEVRVDRVFPWELLVDPHEARDGCPRNLFHLHHIDRDVALHEFIVLAEGLSDERQQQIRSALENAQLAKIDGADITRVSQQIQIVEAWRLPLDDETPGRHVFAIDGTLLHDEPWPWDDFPFAWLRWAPERLGFGGQGLLEEIQTIQAELNDWAQRMQSNVHIRGGRRLFVPRGSCDENELQASEEETIVWYNGDRAPEVEQTPPFTPQDMEWGDRLRALCYQVTGESEMSATARKEPGIESGVALRTMSALVSKRFAPKSRRYEMLFVALGRWLPRLAATIPGYQVQVEQDGYYDEISWGDVALDEDQVRIRIAPASSLPDDLAGRLAFVQEMFGAGLIDGVAFRRLMDAPDLEKEFARDHAAFKYLEKLIAKYWNATPEDVETPGFREHPEPFMLLFGVPSSMLQLAAAYFDAKRRGAPEYILDLIRDYICELDELAKREAQQAQAMRAQGEATPEQLQAVPPPPAAPQQAA